jgi:periplasmic divalent cation tolerance protein
MSDSYCVILTTTGNLQEAENMARMLVSRKLAACVQVSGVSSTYMWKGELRREPEHLLLIKTLSSRFGDIQAVILENHSYEVPEIVQLPVEKGLPAYLEWISENTSSGGAPRP